MCNGYARDAFDGSFDCPWKCYANACVGDLGVRVSFAPGPGGVGGVGAGTSGLNFTYGGQQYSIPPTAGSLNGTWQLNNTWPPLGDGNQTAGANVLRQGFQWNIWTGPRSGDAPLWQYDSTVFYQPPDAITVTVRSAFDPYLMYLSRTGGSGWLGADRTTVLIFASCFIAFGSICILVTLIVGPCLCWGKGLVSKSPFKKPDGMAGMAWECAMGCCPPHRISPEQMPPSAANQTSPNIIYPVAAPVMVPGPYPPAGPGGYLPGPEGHPPPGGYPPQPGGPPPGYPPPPPGQPAAAGHPPGYPSPGPSPGPAAGPPAGGGAPPSVPTPAAPPPGHLAPLGPPAQSPSMRR
ncbi:hypothetical protein HYH03_016434 [Edaphochlamys debaryana]|uniref:Uncharacterized protein n=1 Tax=Edaphochlamys debaryana TaxID=47281 RepID=A0A836BRG4_9CHLO|nr:hypothetical protein HYH03_016433 [Edaphochlamys debaryana]KAG2484780.1 hypothetical protein HYH03_016434 [Edaphochlamys debaryana]|eukprot:KAG2484779.1 hypothetical protein HYH03_016433 [Edaphochlamys debaryana]